MRGAFVGQQLVARSIRRDAWATEPFAFFLLLFSGFYHDLFELLADNHVLCSNFAYC